MAPPDGEEFPPLPSTSKRLKGMKEHEHDCGKETKKKTGEWTTVGRKKGVRNKDPNIRAEREGGKRGSNPQSERKKVGVEGERGNKIFSKAPIKRRAPKTAAVTITGRDPYFSYAKALRRAREEISLKYLRIENSRIRKTVNGGFLVEIAGPEGATKAESLAGKLKQVLRDQAVVARPSVKGELRLIGLDDSSTEEEAKCVLANIGGCDPEEVKTGPIRKMRNGLETIWAQCSLAATLQIISLGKIRIGCTVARVELLRARPLQCYKCWEYSHVRSGCKTEIDRSNMCYRYGSNGHNARSCSEKPSCTICMEKGLSRQHRMGSLACTLVNHKSKQTQPGRRNRATENNGP